MNGVLRQIADLQNQVIRFKGELQHARAELRQWKLLTAFQTWYGNALSRDNVVTLMQGFLERYDADTDLLCDTDEEPK